MPKGVYQRTKKHRDAIAKAARDRPKNNPVLSAALKAKWKDPEFRAKQMAYRSSDEFKEMVSLANTGKTRSQEHKDAVSRAQFVHGLSKHPLFSMWNNIIYRCTDPDRHDYGSYGGRGITVCDEWLDPVVFIAYIESELGPRPPKHSIDRIDNNGNYEPGNLRWATHSEQMRNRRPRSEWKNA